MAFKSIVAVASGKESDVHLFNAAAHLAGACGARVRVLSAYPNPAADLISFGVALEGAPPGLTERMRESERAQHEQMQSRLADAASRAGVLFGAKPEGASIEAEERALMPSAALAEAVVLADLVMIAGDAAREALSSLFAETLLQARAPILIVNDDQFSVGGVAVAWDGSAEAGRAVRAAAPLLGLAEEAVILQNVSDLGAAASKTAASDALGIYLARHGVKRVRRLAVEGDNVAASLLRGAHDARCGTLVAGAYGRPRLYELALGGTTRSLVNTANRTHLFLAH